MITIDGNFQEGGGQIVRTALALSVITGKAFTVENIRKGREIPGLKAQHLHGIKALKKLCNADAKGDKQGSEILHFAPKKFETTDLEIDIGTAGSITLVLQALILPIIHGKKPCTIKIKGGTDVAWSQPIDYFTNVFVPLISAFADIKVEVKKRGHYPKGGGIVNISITPKHGFVPFDLVMHDEILGIRGVSHASHHLRGLDVAERQLNSAKRHLENIANVEISIDYSQTSSPGSTIVLWAEYPKTRVGVDNLGVRGKAAEQIGEEAAKKLIHEINQGAVVDSNAADALIPFLGLACGSIKTSKITKHTLANIYVTEQFLPVKFQIKDGVISCNRIETK